MVRNIDLPEAIVFYGLNSIVDTKSKEPLPGVEAMLRECKQIGAASILLLDQTVTSEDSIVGLKENYGLEVHVDTAHPPPNPRALWEAIESTCIQPKGFGGSSGFGTKLPEPERIPLPQHVVVLAHTLDQCRAARFFGARVMSLVDNDLADGIVFDWSEIGVDDVSTPGSYWLNPPFGSKDDEGNKVDMLEIMKNYEARENTSLGSSNDNVLDTDLSEEALNAILNDLEPL